MKTTVRLARHAGACCLVGFVLAGTSITSGQVPDTLMKAKALYADASYDEALTVLKNSDAAEAHQYRALCLIALGRTQEAERALEALINAAPTYAIDELSNMTGDTLQLFLRDIRRHPLLSLLRRKQRRRRLRAGFTM